MLHKGFENGSSYFYLISILKQVHQCLDQYCTKELESGHRGHREISSQSPREEKKNIQKDLKKYMGELLGVNT